MIAFDLDGTLIDLDVKIEAVRGEIRTFFAGLGYDREMRPILGAIKAAAVAIEGDSPRAEQLEAQARGFIDAAEKEAAVRAPFRPGIAGLATLVGPFAMVTNNSRECAVLAASRLGALGVHFAANIVSRDDVRSPKPSPEGLRAAWEMLGRPPSIEWVGDSIADIEAGTRFRRQPSPCELIIVGVRGGKNSESELIEAGADWVARDLEQFARRSRVRDH